MVPYLSLMSTVATCVAAAAAVASWRAVGTANRTAESANRTAESANRTAESANRTAESLGDLERRRRHSELTPKFRIKLESLTEDRYQLSVLLMGPPGLDRLDRLSLTIRDNVRDQHPAPSGSPTESDIANQIWGPYRFALDVSGATDSGRSVAPVLSLLSGDDCVFILEDTRPPFWWKAGDAIWRSTYAFLPNRLTLLCERGDYEPWTVAVEYPNYLN